MARQLVDVQLLHNGEDIGDRYTSSVDHTNPNDIRALLTDAKTHAGVTGDGYAIKAWNHATGKELFTFA